LGTQIEPAIVVNIGDGHGLGLQLDGLSSIRRERAFLVAVKDFHVHIARKRDVQISIVVKVRNVGRSRVFGARDELAPCVRVNSRYGNLKQTVIELIRRSSAGLDAGEMGSLLGLDPRSFLSSFADHPQIRREKVQGRFVYYCADRSVYSGQRRRRNVLSAKGRQPTASEAIAILVEKIKHPALSNEALSRRLKKQKLSVEPETIKNLFVRHGLAVKKSLVGFDPLPFRLSCQVV